MYRYQKNSTYYQKKSKKLLNRAKEYYENNREKLREQAKNKYTELFNKKIIRKEDMEQIDIKMYLKKIKKPKRIPKKLPVKQKNQVYFFFMPRTRFRVNPHFIVAWMPRNALLRAGAKSEN